MKHSKTRRETRGRRQRRLVDNGGDTGRDLRRDDKREERHRHTGETKTPAAAYRGQTAAHVAIGDGEAGLVDGLLEDQVDDALQPLLCVDGQVGHLLHQLVEHLGGELVEDAPHLPAQLLAGWGGQGETC